ncbi:unnamed protein product [Chironomus riparius]|uniref:Uncharacterized protein n=1 Tax=Chironomus riparius TaxID=315576 RepID=A0A9N9S4U8_9DIPT|nr:unnamed protein product [Chironomus riparius]
MSNLKYFRILIILTTLIHQNLANSSTINCDFKKFGSAYQCVVKNVEIFKTKNTLTDAIGSHDGLKTNDDVSWIIISHGIINKFPAGIDKIFKNLEGIRITNMDLKSVNQEDLKAIKKLKFLNLSSNKITRIDANLFQFNPQLEHISLSNNEISHIDPQAFSGLKSLNQLFLRGNKCKNKLLLRSAEDKEQVRKLIRDIEAGNCE